MVGEAIRKGYGLRRLNMSEAEGNQALLVHLADPLLVGTKQTRHAKAHQLQRLPDDQRVGVIGDIRRGSPGMQRLAANGALLSKRLRLGGEVVLKRALDLQRPLDVHVVRMCLDIGELLRRDQPDLALRLRDGDPHLAPMPAAVHLREDGPHLPATIAPCGGGKVGVISKGVHGDLFPTAVPEARGPSPPPEKPGGPCRRARSPGSARP